MQSYTVTQQGFSYGEVKPALRGASASQVYQLGLKRLSNAYMNAMGSIYKRSGSEVLNVYIPSNLNVKIKSVYTGGMQYSVIFYDHTLVVYSDNLNTVITYVGTEYLDSEIEELSIASVLNTIYIVHKNHCPMMLVNNSNASGFVTLSYENKGTTSLTPPTGVRELLLDNVQGVYTWMLKPVVFVAGSPFSEIKGWPKCQAFKSGRWLLGSTLSRPNTIWASRSADSEGNSRFNDFTLADKYTRTVVTTRVIIKYQSSQEVISDVSSSNNVEAPYKNGDVETTTIGAWTTRSYENVNGVMLDEYTQVTTQTYFTYIVLDSHAIELTETDMDDSEMKWIANQTRVLVGYGRSIWMDTGAGLTPSTFDLQKTLSLGNSSVNPVQFGSMVFFVGFDSRSIIAVSYDNNSGGFTSVDISQTATHLLYNGIKSMAVVDGAMPVLYCVINDGSLVSCTLNLNAGTFGWSRVEFGHPTKVTAIDVLYSDDRDFLYFVAVDNYGATLRRLSVRDEEDGNNIYLDRFQRFKYTDDSSEISINNELYPMGSVVDSFIDGALYENIKVGDGIINLPESGRDIIIGERYVMEVETLNPELPANGTSMCKNRQLVELYACVCSSKIFKASISKRGIGSVDLLGMVYGASIPVDAPQDFTGYVNIPLQSSINKEVSVKIESDLPFPFTLCSTIGKYQIQEV